MTYQLKAIGKVKNDENGTFIQLKPEYIPGLQALEGFSHINVLLVVQRLRQRRRPE